MTIDTPVISCPKMERNDTSIETKETIYKKCHNGCILVLETCYNLSCCIFTIFETCFCSPPSRSDSDNTLLIIAITNPIIYSNNTN